MKRTMMFLFLVVNIFLIGNEFKYKMYLVYVPEKAPIVGVYAQFPFYILSKVQ